MKINIKQERGKNMLINKKTRKINTITFGITPEEAKKVRRQKELEKMPTLENRLKKAKRNARRRELQRKFQIESDRYNRKIKKLL